MKSRFMERTIEFGSVGPGLQPRTEEGDILHEGVTVQYSAGRGGLLAFGGAHDATLVLRFGPGGLRVQAAEDVIEFGVRGRFRKWQRVYTGGYAAGAKTFRGGLDRVEFGF